MKGTFLYPGRPVALRRDNFFTESNAGSGGQSVTGIQSAISRSNNRAEIFRKISIKRRPLTKALSPAGV